MAAAVSIVVPVYNAEKYLPRCMASLLAQTLSDLQIILVDDGSRDSSGRLCDAYAVQDARVTVIHQTNRGAGFARNAGLDAAAGEYVGFVDADDEIEPAMFERLYEAAKKHDADMALSGMKQISAADETDVREVGGFEREQRFVSEEEREQLLLGVAGALPHEPEDSRYNFAVYKNIYRNRIIQDNGIRFESERNIMSEDVIFLIDFILKIQSAVGIPGAYYHYYRYDSSLSSAYREGRYLRFKGLVEEIRRRYSKRIPEERFRLYTDRLLQSGARTAIMMEAAHAQAISMPHGELRQRLLAICGEEELQRVLGRYPYWKLPKKQAVFAFAMHRKLVRLQLLLIGLRGQR